MPKITKMWAYTITEDNGDEGIIAFTMDNGMWMPLVGADMDRVVSLQPYAEKTAKIVGKPYNLLKFKIIERYNENGDVIHED